jgi:hypothetical protein
MTAIHLTVHENAADFLAAAGAFLNLSEAENSIVSISAAHMVSGPTGDDADTTDVANPTSNSIYRKIGYLAAADHYHFDFLPPPT